MVTWPRSPQVRGRSTEEACFLFFPMILKDLEYSLWRIETTLLIDTTLVSLSSRLVTSLGNLVVVQLGPRDATAVQNFLLVSLVVSVRRWSLAWSAAGFAEGHVPVSIGDTPNMID